MVLIAVQFDWAVHGTYLQHVSHYKKLINFNKNHITKIANKKKRSASQNLYRKRMQKYKRVHIFPVHLASCPTSSPSTQKTDLNSS